VEGGGQVIVLSSGIKRHAVLWKSTDVSGERIASFFETSVTAVGKRSFRSVFLPGLLFVPEDGDDMFLRNTS
jgi:hypothetical protein